MFECQERLLGMQMVRSGDDDDIGPGFVEQGYEIVAGGSVGVDLVLSVELVLVRIDECDDLAATVPGGYLGYMTAGAAAAGDKEGEASHDWPFAV